MNEDLVSKELVSLYEDMDYDVFLRDEYNYNLNIFGIRNENAKPNEWSCVIGQLWKYKGKFYLNLNKGTTLPGTPWLKNPMNSKGTAILPEGQYQSSWKYGWHKGYRALQQFLSLPVYRDNDKDNLVDLHPNSIDKGWFGINIHTTKRWLPKFIQFASAGCQVIRNTLKFKKFMKNVKESTKTYGDYFTYTLFNSKDLHPDLWSIIKEEVGIK
jgi:hypothetical protein